MKKVIEKRKLKSREKLLKKLAEMDLKLAPVYYQHDRVYVPRGYKPNANFARMILRTEMKQVAKVPRYRLILKRHIADSGMDIVYDSIVKDYAEVVQMVHQLGYEKQAEVSRQREELKLGEGSKLYIDKVEGLPGYFAKIENELKDDEKISEIREDLVRTFEILGETEEEKATYAEAIAD